MVESTKAEGDGVNRPISYAKFRTDKEASPGYSAELVSDLLEPQYYDDMRSRPPPEGKEDIKTLLDLFNKNVEEGKDDPFLGTRYKIDADAAKGSPNYGAYGPYQWKTYGEVSEAKSNLAKGLMTLDACPEVGDEGFRFCGIWAKNRWEWMTTLLACMHYKITVVGFYDAMGVSSVEFILNQTEMSSIICSSEYCEKIYNMKKDGMAQYIKCLVVLDDKRSKEDQAKLDEMIKQLNDDYQVQVRMFSDVMDEG